MNKTKNAKNKGITLIALIITIIVMLILVTVSITMAVKGGLFKYASDAGKKTNEAITKEGELADLEEGLSTDDLIARFTGGWYEKSDGVFTNGTYTVNLGDYIDYKCYNGEELIYTSQEAKNGYSDQTFTVNSDTNNIEWQVLGVENGQLLIVMKGQVYPDNSDGYYWQGAEALKYGIDELNEISKLYGHGKNSVGARSITVEDVNKVTGYNPLKDPNYGGKAWQHGELDEYGNEVTYSLTSGGIKFEGKNGKTGIMEGIDLKLLEPGKTENTTSLTVKSTRYDYDSSIVSSPTKESLAFLDGDLDCWIATPFVVAGEGVVERGFLYVGGGGVYGDDPLYSSSYGDNSSHNGVRPVVSLKSDIKLKPTENKANSWDFAD